MILPFLLALAATGPAAMPPVSTATPLDYPGLVNDAIDGGRIIQAEAMVAQWRVEAPVEDRQKIDLAIARIALERRQDGKAAARFAALKTGGSTDCRIDEGLGIALVRLGRADEAVTPLRHAADACPGRWKAWNALAIAYDHQQNWALSASAYEHAFQLTDQPAQLLNNYGLSLLKQGQAEKAVVIFGKALDLAPADAKIIANADSATVMSGQDIKRRAGESANDWAARLNNAGQVALRIGDMPKAQAYLSRAVTDADDFVPEAAAALATMRSGNP